MARLLTILLLLPFVQQAQIGYTFNRLNAYFEDGLASNTVYITYQDKKGYIWAGTPNGLQRFDGNKFVKFNSSNPEQHDLFWSELGQILPAGENELWLYFPARGEAGIFNTRSREYNPVPINIKQSGSSQTDNKLWQDSRGNTFLLLPDQAILHYDAKRGQFVRDDLLPLPKGWRPGIRLFEDTVRGHIWVPCVDSGVAVIDMRTRQVFTRHYNPKRLPLLSKKELQTDLVEIFIDRQRRHWVFYFNKQQQRHCYDENGKPLPDTLGLNTAPEYPRFHQFFQAHGGSLWIYGNNFLYSLDNQAGRFHFYHPSRSQSNLEYQHIYHLMEDRDGNIWLSTDAGLFYTSAGNEARAVVNILFDEDKSEFEISDIMQLQSGEYWLSTWGEGILALDRNFNRIESHLYSPSPPAENAADKLYRQVWGMFQNNDGKVWLGCQAGRYMVYDPATAHTSYHLLEEANGAPVRYITAGKNGNLFFVTHRGRIIRYNGKTFTLVQDFNTVIPKILVDKKGLIWVVTVNQGLYNLSADGSSIIHHFTAGGKVLYSNTGYDIDQLNDSVLVLGAGSLHFININTGAVTQKTVDDGLPGNSIRKIRKDASGNIWIVTLNGLCRYSPATTLFTQYEQKDGITLATRARNADLLSRDGYILFGGTNAFYAFHPALFQTSGPPPDVTITDIRLFNRYLSVDSLASLKKVSFAPGQNTLRFYFSALSYGQKGKLTYYYKLDGVHTGWVKADRANAVDFTLLPPGEYKLSLYAVDIDGQRSRNITEFSFVVRPHFWQTAWFPVLLAIALAALGYYLHRQRVNRLLAVEAVRSRVARDLHDDVGSTLSTINILGSMAKSRLQTDAVRTGEYISKITENSQRMMEAMDDIVWSIKPDNDTVQKMVVRMKEFALSLLEAKDIALRMRVDDKVGTLKLNMEARRDLFLIFKEAINNVAKYSKASNVEVHMACHNRRLVLEIKDDGVGFDTNKADGNGLGNMQKRTAALNGRFQLSTKPGEGTSITVNIPVAQSH